MMAGGVYRTLDLLHDLLGGSRVADVLTSATVEHVTTTREDGDDFLRTTTPLKYMLWFPPIIAAGRRDVQSGRIEFLRRTPMRAIPA
jgi:hypothetical protein